MTETLPAQPTQGWAGKPIGTFMAASNGGLWVDVGRDPYEARQHMVLLSHQTGETIRLLRLTPQGVQDHGSTFGDLHQMQLF